MQVLSLCFCPIQSIYFESTSQSSMLQPSPPLSTQGSASLASVQLKTPSPLTSNLERSQFAPKKFPIHWIGLREHCDPESPNKPHISWEKSVVSG